MKVQFHKFGAVAEDQIVFVVITSWHHGQWIVVRHQHRSTWEIPGGHREAGEDLEAAARRELYEETGALEFELQPVADYSVDRNSIVTYGRLFFAEVSSIGKLPEMEIQEIRLVGRFPDDNLTYPQIQPLLHQKVEEHLRKSFFRLSAEV